MYTPKLKRKKSKSRLIRQSISCITSNVTLVLVVILYIVAGGFLFVFTESEPERNRLKEGFEKIQRFKKNFSETSRLQIENLAKEILNETNRYLDKIKKTLKKMEAHKTRPRGRAGNFQDTFAFLEQIKNDTNHFCNSSINKFKNKVLKNISRPRDKNIDRFVEQIFNMTQQGFIANYKENQTVLWTYAGAILYSVTVITTIGYGNIVPQTNNGKIATIIYAMFGIPLMVLCLTNLGSLFGKGFKIFYKCLRNRMKCRRRQLTKSASVISLTETQSQYDSKSFTVPNNKLIGKNLLLLSSSSTNLTRITESSEEKQRKLHFTISIDTGDFMNNLHRKDECELPLILPLSVFIVYILVGAFLISVWEGWVYLNSCYFVFITFSTIGFGDLVPGLLNSQWKNESKPIICAIYLFFGLVLLSMCFQLIQDMLRVRALKLGKHIGLVKSPSPA